MKTAISIPDDVYKKAESLARRMRVSRSRLYSQAVGEFVNRFDGQAVTRKLNEVYGRTSSKSDAFMKRAARKVMSKQEW